MSTLTATPEHDIDYPDSDGKPMAENTVQYRWITTVQGNLDILFHKQPDVFVAGDNLWYPVKGKPGICLAPDVYVAFGRPKGDRGSYKQWEEAGIPPAVVFEVLSPSNTSSEMRGKFEFYQRYGAQEYYVIDPQQPDRTTLIAFEREKDVLKPRDSMPEWVSPLMGVRFVVTSNTVELFYPDGKPFLSFVELGEALQTERQQTEAQRQQTEAQRQRAEAERQRAEAERQRAEAERQRADDEQQRAETERQRAETERQRADDERRHAAKLADKLRELGIDPNAV